MEPDSLLHAEVSTDTVAGSSVLADTNWGACQECDVGHVTLVNA